MSAHTVHSAQRQLILLLFLLAGTWPCCQCANTSLSLFRNIEVNFGPCRLVIYGTCPDPDVQYFLYTRWNPSEPQLIDLREGMSNLTASDFNVSNPTKFIIHGYNSGMDLDVLVDIRKAYLKKGEYNIFAVDWSRLSPGPCYPTAVYNARFAGQCIGQFIDNLRQDVSDIHVVGFSLGAHVAGFAANNLRPYKLPRITGLDPAMPFFVTVDRDNKLDVTDAHFVDVIHTNAFIQGKIEASGDVDFYVNGGINQPGCWSDSNPFGCNHHRAPAYFAESILSEKGFWGWYCYGFVPFLLGLCPPKYPVVIMGDSVPVTSRGFYLVKTAAEKPFALGEWILSPEDDLQLKHKDKFPEVNDVESVIVDPYWNEPSVFEV